MKKLLILFLLVNNIDFIAQTNAGSKDAKMLPAEVVFFGKDTPQEVEMKYEEPFIYSAPYYEFIINRTKYKSADIAAFKINGKVWARRTDPSPKQEDIQKDKLAGKTMHTTQARIELQGAIQVYAIYRTGTDGYVENAYIQKVNGQIKEIVDDPNAKVREELMIKILIEFVSDCPDIANELQEAISLTKTNSEKMIEFKKNDSIAVANHKKEQKDKGMGKASDEEAFNRERSEQRAEIGATEIDLERIINNYNVWYNSQNPGKITYYFISPPERQTSQIEQERLFQFANLEKNKEKNEKEAERKRVEALYANRSTKVSAEYASAKNNEAVKKETFAAKLDRIKADGNKVAVLFILNPVKSKPSQNNSTTNSMASSSIREDVFIPGEYFDESLQKLGKDFTEELKTSLNRTDIDLIDLANIPYRDTKVFGSATRIDNFWATKYKIIFIYSVEPLIDAGRERMSGNNKFEATLKFGSSLVVNEYLGDPESKEKDVITQMTGMGAFSTNKITSDVDIMNIKQVYEKILEKMNPPFPEKIKTERASGVKKLVEKKLAP